MTCTMKRPERVLEHSPGLNTLNLHERPSMSAATVPAISAVVKIPNGEPGVEYRLVPGFEGYAVGDDGSVWSRIRANRWHGHIPMEWHKLKPNLHTNGYPFVWITNIGRKRKRGFVHILVLTAFRGQCPAGMEARHYPDRSTTNCRLKNLSWASSQTNQLDRIEHGTHIRGNRHHGRVIDESQARQIKHLLKLGARQCDLASQFGVKKWIIQAIKCGRTWAWLD